MKKGWDERFVETTIGRIRFFFSIEFACSMGLFLGLVKIAEILGFVQKYVRNDLITLILCITSMIVVYGIGELIRRRFKFKSLLLDSKNKNE